MANRNSQASTPSLESVNQAAAAFGKISLTERPAMGPSLRSTRTGPPVGAGQRRRGPDLRLRDILGPDGGGAESVSAAGLGAGRPAQRSPIRKGPSAAAGTPFSNFQKIV